MVVDPKVRRASFHVSAHKALTLLLAFLVVLLIGTLMFLQGQSGATDPGVRGGPAGAGGPISGLSASETLFFNEGQARFEEIDSVSGGLGPRFNMK